MSKLTFGEKTALPSWTARVLGLSAVLLVSVVLPSHAKQGTGQFAVTLTLAANGQPVSGLCRSATQVGIFGAAVVVACATGQAVEFTGDATTLPWTSASDGSYRYVTQVSQGGETLGTVDSYAGGATATSWRVIRVADRDYIEMMVHW
jgi:hypothetical protein